MDVNCKSVSIVATCSSGGNNLRMDVNGKVVSR